MSNIIICQTIHGEPKLFSPEDKEKYSNYKENQLTKHVVTGTNKERSLTQLRTFMACCQHVADNVPEYDLTHPNFKDGAYWNTKDKAAFQVKVATHFVDDSKTIVAGNQIFFHYRSLGFENLRHMEACFFFDRGFKMLALRIGVTEAVLVQAAKNKMARK